MAKIVLRRVTKSFGSKVAVDDLNLEVEDGEFVIVVGPSGCGKTTTLRMIAGFETPSMGSLHIGDTLMNHVAPKDRNLAMVFQNYALFPHMSVARNLSFGLRIRHASKKEIDSQVHEIAEMLGILALLDSKPSQLSGGERQRVALGRALLRKPQAFLLDEPLSNLDAALRAQMRFTRDALRRASECLRGRLHRQPQDQSRLRADRPFWRGQRAALSCHDHPRDAGDR
jgi:multiple sugar transport system ATP-binding protein